MVKSGSPANQTCPGGITTGSEYCVTYDDEGTDGGDGGTRVLVGVVSSGDVDGEFDGSGTGDTTRAALFGES